MIGIEIIVTGLYRREGRKERSKIFVMVVTLGDQLLKVGIVFPLRLPEHIILDHYK